MNAARSTIFHAVRATLILLAGTLVAEAQLAATSPGTTCARETIGDVAVAAVIDGRTFMAADGREVRLAGIEAPANAKAALASLIAGKTVTLKRADDDDRYGRLRADVYLGDASIQQELLSGGNAYVAARAGPKPCADELFAAERTARDASLGAWRDPELRPKSAANREDILRAKGRFALVAGKVLSVRDAGGTTYLNFGRRYTRDFSVVIARRDAAKLAAAGVDPKLLQGKTVRVRGVIEERAGPIIEVKFPEQIELIR